MTKRQRKMKIARIDFISLCGRGRNKLPVIYKSEDALTSNVEFNGILAKDMDEEGVIVACVYAPDLLDTDQEWAPEEVIKEFAYEFQRNGGQLDIRHNEQAIPRDDAFIAESFIIQKGDPRFADMRTYDGKSVDVTGGWGVVIKVDSDELQNAYRKGEFAGVSMGGRALFEEQSLYAQAVTKHKEQDDMPIDETTLQNMLTNQATAITKGIVEALDARDADKVKKAEDAKKAKELEDLKKAKANEVVFEGDPRNPEDVRKHQEKLALAKVDWSDPASVKKHLDSLEKGDDGKTDENLTEDEKKIKKAEAEIARQQAEIKRPKGGSNQGAGDSVNKGESTPEERGTEEAHQALVEAGIRKADDPKQGRGYLLR